MALGKQTEPYKYQAVPKLSRNHYDEITELVKKYGGINQVHAYWGAVRLDDEGSIVAVKDYSEQSEYSFQKYEKFEPLSGIFYVGHGDMTYKPYDWTRSWIEQWEKWIKATDDERSRMLLIKSPIQFRKS